MGLVEDGVLHHKLTAEAKKVENFRLLVVYIPGERVSKVTLIYGTQFYEERAIFQLVAALER